MFEVRAFGVVPGPGSHVSWEERLDGRLAMALASIQAVKGVGLGEGFDLAGKPGSQAHDEIFYGEDRGFYRETNHSGGLEGGMTTGEVLTCRAALKPIPTLTKPLCLMAANYPEVRERIFERYPYFRSSYFERRKLFERSNVQSEPLAPVNLPAFPFARAAATPRS